MSFLNATAFSQGQSDTSMPTIAEKVSPVANDPLLEEGIRKAILAVYGINKVIGFQPLQGLMNSPFSLLPCRTEILYQKDITFWYKIYPSPSLRESKISAVQAPKSYRRPHLPFCLSSAALASRTRFNSL